MELELGRHTFDVATRTLVMAMTDAGCGRAELVEIVGERPALIEIVDESQLATVRQIFAGPVAIRTSDAHLAERCLANGADIAHDPAGLADPRYLAVVEEAAASVIIGCPNGGSGAADLASFLTERARWAEVAGIPRPKIVLHIAAGRSDAFRDHGYPLMITTEAGAEVQGTHVMAAMAGVGIVAARDVRATRRTVDTVAELLARRDSATPVLTAGVVV